MTGDVIEGIPAVDVDLALLDRDPMGVWSGLRRKTPVVRLDPLDLVAVLRYDDVKRVARDSAAFSAVVDAPLARTIGNNFMYADGDNHRRVRSLVTPLLQPAALSASHATWIDAEVKRLVGTLPVGATVDLMTAVAEPLAISVLRRIIGLDAPDADYGRWFKVIAAAAANFEADQGKGAAAAGVMAELDDLVGGAPLREGTLVGVFADRPRADVLGAIGLFLIGGLQEPRDLLGLTLIGLLSAPDQLAAIREAADPRAGLARAIEEAARWGSPVGTVTRVTTSEVEVGDVCIPAGTVVAGILASANRDERRWTEPDVFRAHRDEGPHLAFGTGAHACVGAAAARVLTLAAGAALLLERDLTLVAEPSLVGYEFRGPRDVQVVVT